MSVFPVHNNVFKIGIGGRASTAEQMVIIKDVETFSPTVDNNVEEWNSMDAEGWIRRALTGKGMTIGMAGKRNVGDPGNDYVAQSLMSIGSAAETKFEWTMPDGSTLAGNCILSTTTPGGGDASALDGLEFDILTDGKPVFTPET